MKKVLIIGATSGIGRALAHLLAGRGCGLFLAGRDSINLRHLGADLEIRYKTEVRTGTFEADDFHTHAPLIENALTQLGGLDMAISCLGYLGDQKKAAADSVEAERIISRNLTAVESLLNPIISFFELQRRGTIVALSSVAGDRGRQSNYHYGAAKGGLTLFLQGARNRLARNGVHVMTVKPGFVDTKMTYGLPGLFLLSSPEKTATDILKAVAGKKNVCYTPWFWRWIMLAIRLIPENIFKRLSL